MRRGLLAFATVAVTAVVTTAFAQETRAREPEASATVEDAARETPRRSIRVLQHPHDISSFYRSGESALGPWAGLPNDPSYRIAGFYRSHQGGYPSSPYGWSAFWTNGYAAPRPAPFPGYRRTIGENGDLFLMVPFLAPVGPINSAFVGY